MPYPAKTDREAILGAAMEHLVTDGLRALSLRTLAASLQIAPNALYRYFANRAELELALSNESARRLHAVLLRATGKKPANDAIRSMARAYLRFAREQPSLYEAMLMPHNEPDVTCKAHSELWQFVVQQVARVSNPASAPEAAVALWALLHGMAGLEAARVFGPAKPSTGFDFGLRAWFQEAGSAG